MNPQTSLHKTSYLIEFTIDVTVLSEISVALYEKTEVLILKETKTFICVTTGKSYFNPHGSLFQINSVLVTLTDDTDYYDITGEGETTFSLNMDKKTKKLITFLNVICFLLSLKHTSVNIKSSIKPGHAYTLNTDHKCVSIDEVKCHGPSKDDHDLLYIGINATQVKINITRLTAV